MQSKSLLRIAAAASLVALAASTSPAGAQAPADDGPYARYTSVAQCLEGAVRMTAFYWRDKRRDTVRYAPATDSTPAIVRDSLRLCASRFSVPTLASDDVLPMLQLALLTGDTATVTAAAARLQRDLAALAAGRRAWVLENIASAFILTTPSRLARGRQYVRALDALGPPAAYERLSAHRIVSGYAWSVGELALADSEAKAAIAAIAELKRPEQINLADTISAVYELAASIANVRWGPNAATALLDTGSALALPLTQAGGPRDAYRRARMENIFAYYRKLYGADGVSPKPVRADRWFGKDGVAGDTIFPRGRVTLALFVNPRGLSFPSIAVVRRLHDEFAARGLDIVLMTYTAGFFRTQITANPANETRRFQDWFVGYLHLPLTVAVEESQFGHLADGRRQNVPMANEKEYSYGANAVLVGKNGAIRTALDLASQNEQVYRQLIAEELAR